MVVSSVAGAFSIVACSSRGWRLNASNVSAMLPNSSACTFATGATWADARPICLKNSSSSVSGSLRLVMTGSRLLKNGLKAPMASLSDWPRPASASP